MRMVLIFALSIISIPSFSQKQFVYQRICQQSKTESLVPIRPGIPGKQPFWNWEAIMFKYAPSFQNDGASWIIPDPKYYRYSAFSFKDKQYYTFRANSPYEALTPIWDKLPNGEVYLKVEAVSVDEKDFVLAGSKLFYKTAVFCPPYQKAKYSYKNALIKGLYFMYNQEHIKNWYKTGEPDLNKYKLYCYSALEVGSVVDAMLLFNKYFPQNDSSLFIACKAADYLIAKSEPRGTPLEFFPQIYEGSDMFAGTFKEEVMMKAPASSGMSFLALFDRTGEQKYLNAAIQIADTYLKTQLPSGTWYIRIKKETGKPASEELCIPITIINFLSALADKYQYSKYQKSIYSAIKWI